jgi:carboxymethylenebutenolidase
MRANRRARDNQVEDTMGTSISFKRPDGKEAKGYLANASRGNAPGVVVPYHDVDAANKEMNSLDFIDATTQTVRGAAQYLARNGAKVGLTGFCLGGAVTVIGVCKIPELAAGVAFYGIPPEQAAKPADVRVPLQGHFASRDDWCTPQVVDAFEQGLKAAGKSAEIFRYEADHAFVNEQRAAVHDREAAELAWGRATEFFKKHLG